MSQESADPSPAHWPGRIYDGTLRKAEEVLVTVLLVVVLGLSTVEILVRNLQLDLFDVVPAQLVTYYLAFHLGLFAAGLACRRARHISIDAVGPHLPEHARHGVMAVLFVVSALVCVHLCQLSWRYVFEFLHAEMHVLTDRTGWLWSERLWKAPMVAAFGLMALHFLVHGLREARSFLRGGAGS